jgi:hypothetical protein
MVTDAYPIVDYANIKIDAKIVGMDNLDIPNPPPSEDPTSPDFGEGDPEKMKAKRRIINGITQGASIRGAFGFLLFKEYIDDINPELVNKYNEILKEFALSDHYTTCILILFLKLSPRQINEFLRILYCSKNHIDIPRHSYHYNNFLFIFTIHTIISVYDLNITKKIAENAYDWSVFFEKLNTEGDIDNKKFINSIMQFLIVAMSRTDFEIYITKHDDSRFKLNVEELRSFHCTYVSKNQEFAQIILNIQNQTVA